MKRYCIIPALVLLSSASWAQNLNPEVQVTNDYQNRIDDVSKKGVAMTIPDSLLRFDYHFDYSVFDSPYKGAYEFSPYSVTITPDARPYDGRRLYLRAGAGYVLKPEFDLVWSAVDRKKFSVNAFASAGGFYGNYKHVQPHTFVREKGVFDRGWDFASSVGADARINIGKTLLRTEFGYDGIYTGHDIYSGGNTHSPYVSAHIGSNSGRRILYNAGVTYRYVYDALSSGSSIHENELTLDAVFSAVTDASFKVSSDVELNLNGYYSAFQMHPHAAFRLGAFDFDAGLRFGGYTGKVTLSPAVTVAAHLLHDYLDVYAGADGGNRNLTYWDYRSGAHWYHADYLEPLPVREIADLFGGVRGHADFGLQYDVKAGYRFLRNAPFWAVGDWGYETMRFQDCRAVHADLLLSWASERLNIDGELHYMHIPGGVDDGVFSPSAVTSTFRGSYNWKKRIFAGLSMDIATGRKALAGPAEVKMPGYADVGLWGEYRLDGRLSFWLKCSNILNQDIRTSPLISECGPAVIAGIRFSL
ncbi:MAG: hypothetical protein J1D85_05870 [Bacteroidales bacterium]|nr:hypothetical protein [Bacteroidales bacterium]